MDYREHVESIHVSATAFARVLRSASGDTRIPSCPGWTLADLTRHLGDVHRGALSMLTGAHGQGEDPAPVGAAPLLSWFEAGAEALVTELSRRHGDEPCSTLYPPGVTAVWAKRQALETAIHLWDATSATGRPAAIPVALAVDGVAEVVEGLYPRQVRLGRIQPLDVLVEVRVPDASGTQRIFRLGLGDASGGVNARVDLGAEDALLLLWKRRTLDDVDARVSGSEATLRSVLGAALVP